MEENKSIRHKQCRNCGRMNPRDLGRKYCPVTARSICPNKLADSCGFYIPKPDRCEDEKRRSSDVC